MVFDDEAGEEWCSEVKGEGLMEKGRVSWRMQVFNGGGWCSVVRVHGLMETGGV